MTTNVTIASSNLASISQVMRAALSGANACAKLGCLDQRDVFLDLLAWAEQQHAVVITEVTDRPSLG